MNAKPLMPEGPFRVRTGRGELPGWWTREDLLVLMQRMDDAERDGAEAAGSGEFADYWQPVAAVVEAQAAEPVAVAVQSRGVLDRPLNDFGCPWAVGALVLCVATVGFAVGAMVTGWLGLWAGAGSCGGLALFCAAVASIVSAVRGGSR